jgi:hypothetical protein
MRNRPALSPPCRGAEGRCPVSPAELDTHVDDGLHVAFVAAVVRGNEHAQDAGADHRVDHLVGQALVLISPLGVRPQYRHYVRHALDKLGS